MELNVEKPKMPSEAEMDALYQARLVRCIPVVRKILAILNSHMDNVELGEVAAVEKSLMPVAEEVLGLMLQENILWGDKEFILQMAMQPVAGLNNIVSNALAMSWDKAEKKRWGKDPIDLEFADVHNALIEPGTPPTPAAKE